MDDLTAIVFYVVLIVFLFVGDYIRRTFLRRAEKMSESRSVNSIQGREVIERMLAEENITDVKVEFSDFIVPRYYFNRRRKSVVIPTFSNYSSGMYDVMRCATVASHVIIAKNNSGGLYYRLASFMEVWVRIMPFFIIIMFFLAAIWPFVFLPIIVVVYLLSLLVAVMMRQTDSEAVYNAARWLVKHGIVSDDDNGTFDKLTRYVTNYNLVNVLLAGFAIASGRRELMRWNN